MEPDAEINKAAMQTGETQQLTQRENEVLKLLAKGFSAKEIAKALGIAPRTVDRHIEHIRLKTRTRNRSHLIAFAITNGIIEE